MPLLYDLDAATHELFSLSPLYAPLYDLAAYALFSLSLYDLDAAANALFSLSLRYMHRCMTLMRLQMHYSLSLFAICTAV